MSRRTLITALVVGVLVLMTLAGIGLSLMVASSGAGLGLGGRIAVLEIDGIIADDQGFLDDVRRLRADGSVRGWVVAINSPGGVVAPSQSIYEALRELRDDDDRPVVASIGSVGASGGYYVALGADSILALPGSITGSIGVLMEYPNVSGLMDRMGIEMEVVKAGEQKDLGSPFRSMDEADRAILRAMLEDVHAQFIEVVARERRMEEDDVRPLADGRVLSGRQALAAGLVDALGNRQDAVELAGRMAGLGPDPRIVRPPSDEPWLVRALFGQAAVRALQKVVSPMEGTTPAMKFIMHP